MITRRPIKTTHLTKKTNQAAGAGERRAMASLAKATTEQLLAELQRRLKCADKQEKKTIFIGARLFACLLALLCWIGLGEAGVVPWLGCACLLDVVGGRGERVCCCVVPWSGRWDRPMDGGRLRYALKTWGCAHQSSGSKDRFDSQLSTRASSYCAAATPRPPRVGQGHAGAHHQGGVLPLPPLHRCVQPTIVNERVLCPPSH